MAYISYDYSSPVRTPRRINAPRLAWARLAMIGICAVFWTATALTLSALF